jgi:hypothetical protein
VKAGSSQPISRFRPLASSLRRFLRRLSLKGDRQRRVTDGEARSQRWSRLKAVGGRAALCQRRLFLRAIAASFHSPAVFQRSRMAVDCRADGRRMTSDFLTAEGGFEKGRAGVASFRPSSSSPSFSASCSSLWATGRGVYLWWHDEEDDCRGGHLWGPLGSAFALVSPSAFSPSFVSLFGNGGGWIDGVADP